MWQNNRFTYKTFQDGRKIALFLQFRSFTRSRLLYLLISGDDIWLNRLKVIILSSLVILKSLNIHDSVSRPLFPGHFAVSSGWTERKDRKYIRVVMGRHKEINVLSAELRHGGKVWRGEAESNLKWFSFSKPTHVWHILSKAYFIQLNQTLLRNEYLKCRPAMRHSLINLQWKSEIEIKFYKLQNFPPSSRSLGRIKLQMIYQKITWWMHVAKTLKKRT